MTAAQQRSLKFFAHWGGAHDSRIEYDLQYGVRAAAFDRLVGALTRKGLIEPEHGYVTEKGHEYLRGLVE